MFIRFATLATDSDSGRSGGVLVAAHTLRDDGDLSVQEHETLRTALAWFNDHLPVPAALADPEHRRAISWFKPAADEAIRRMWQLKNLLDLHGHHVNVLRTSDPGTVVYQDDWQVIAKPYRGQRF
ncbi:hypothetical protein AB8810_02220 [Xanthomonas sp. NCPPB 3005]|uniref:hypothetical protein n=1 Tax=Xanthomonas sp. NCPPB 3005 TaxID=3240913 RepID=UPI003518EEDE